MFGPDLSNSPLAMRRYGGRLCLRHASSKEEVPQLAARLMGEVAVGRSDESDYHCARLAREINGLLANDLTATVTSTPT
jgi:hypothetical protein